jgi:penicillin-binding protein-related factor A (putative recombinase)
MTKTVAFFFIFNDKNEVYLTLYDDLIHNILSKSEDRIINRVNGVKSFAKDYAKEKALILLQITVKTGELVFKNVILILLYINSTRY